MSTSLAEIRFGLRLLDQSSVNAFIWLVNHRKWFFGIGIVLFLLVVTDIAIAGTTATEFQSIYTKIKGWVSGYLGKAIALMAFLIGLGVGVVKSSPLPAVAGVVFALFVAFGPAVIEGIATALI